MTEELKNFYPTPKNLIKKMTDKIVKIKNISILEPSAGRGDIIEYIQENKFEILKYYKSENIREIDCVEKNENLQKILMGKNFRIVGDDFLTFNTYKSYDLIIMNPPFDNGDKHLLKAISLFEKSGGGQIICLLNAETLRNPYSVYIKDLVKKL